MITSPYSFVASANCAIYEGATPVFADIDPRTFNLDPAAVEAAITPRTKAVVGVDIFGYPCEIDPLLELCERHGLAFIEDACEALGAEYKGAPVGSQGHPAVWAFYPNKQMTTGEGGAVTTGSADAARVAHLAAEPGPARDLVVAPARTARLQLPPRRPVGGARDRAAREARPDPRGAARCRRGVRRDPAGHRGRAAAGRRRRPRTVVVRLRREAAGGRRSQRRDGAAHRRGNRHRAVPAVDPPAELHARAVRLSRGDAPGERGLQRTHDGAAVPCQARPRRPGTGRRTRCAPRSPSLPAWGWIRVIPGARAASSRACGSIRGRCAGATSATCGSARRFRRSAARSARSPCRTRSTSSRARRPRSVCWGSRRSCRCSSSRSIGGAIADGLDRRVVLLRTEVGMALVTGLFLANALLPHPQVWALFVLQAVAVAIYSLGRPALASLEPPARPGRRDRGGRCGAERLRLARRCRRAGGRRRLIAVAGVPWTYGIDLVTYAASLLATLRAAELAARRGRQTGRACARSSTASASCGAARC